MLTQKERQPAEPGAPRSPFSHMIVGSLQKNAIRARFEGPWAETHFGKQPKATGRKAVAGAFMNQSGKF